MRRSDTKNSINNTKTDSETFSRIEHSTRANERLTYLNSWDILVYALFLYMMLFNTLSIPSVTSVVVFPLSTLTMDAIIMIIIFEFVYQAESQRRMELGLLLKKGLFFDKRTLFLFVPLKKRPR